MLGSPYTKTVKSLIEKLMNAEKSITSGLEDYLEEIYIAQLNDKPLKGAELARKLNISRASVSEGLSRLVSKELIKYSSYEAIYLTKKGMIEAKKVYEKHHILKNFFEKVLEIPADEASENACKIEHIVSQNVLDKMIEFTKFYQENKDLIENCKRKTLNNELIINRQIS